MRTNEALADFLALLEPNIELGSTFQLSHSFVYTPQEEAGGGVKMIPRPEIILVIWVNEIFRPNIPGTFDYEEPAILRKKVLGYRRLKRLFGPFKATGTAPDVTLRGEAERCVGAEKYLVNIRCYGAFKCELQEEKDVPLTEEEKKSNAQRVAQLLRQADRLQTTKTTTQKTWVCKNNMTQGDL
jgi:hypothetical protein